MGDFGFKTYSWVFGTTSLRVSELKYKIEKQLMLLDELKNEYKKGSWQEEQLIYYNLLVRENLANEGVKDPKSQARKKTSSLKDLGLIDKERNITEVGKKILNISKNRKYNNDNILFIRNDSFIYFKQFLKYELTGKAYKKFKLRPFRTIIYLYTKLDKYITNRELKYFIPLIKNQDDLMETIDIIRKDRKDKINIDAYLKDKISNMDNYKEALKYLINHKNLNIDEIKNVMMNRKSTKEPYDDKYFYLFEYLKKYYNNKDKLSKTKKINEIYKIIQLLKKDFNKVTTRDQILKQLTNLEKAPRQNSIKEKITNEVIDFFDNNLVIGAPNIDKFKKEFFYLCHLAKWKTNLTEYYDLNKRFLKLSDIFIFKNEKITLETIPKIIFDKNVEGIITEPLLHQSCNEELYYEKYYRLQKELKEIHPDLEINLVELKEQIKKIYPDMKFKKNIRVQINDRLKREKEERFHNLIDKYFKKENINELLDLFNKGKTNTIESYYEWDTNWTTIFEYIIGIVWYLISNRKGYFEDFFNLDLDADLFPRRFAGGGLPDLSFRYENHSLIIEVTLTKKDNQKRFELEPVTRHLGRKMINDKINTYALFIAPYLDPNVLVSFRSYKNLKYYDVNNQEKYVEGLKIIPLSVTDIKHLINSDINYREFTKLIDELYNEEESDGYIWYHNILKQEIRKMGD